jgi:hypothetical protein
MSHVSLSLERQQHNPTAQYTYVVREEGKKEDCKHKSDINPYLQEYLRGNQRHRMKRA